MVGAMITVLVKRYLGLGSFSWGSVSGYLSFIVVIELTIFIVSVLEGKRDGGGGGGNRLIGAIM